MQREDIRRFFENIAPLETFGPEAFQGGEAVPQELCNLVLALALIFNDLNDLQVAGQILRAAEPDPPKRKSRKWGSWIAMDYHSFRLFAGILHELLSVLADNRTQLGHPLFVSITKQLSAGARKAWAAVVAASDQAALPKDPLGKSLVFIRNKAASHYDPKAISLGYRRHFFESGRNGERAYISRGVMPWETRFYFADAAVAGLRQRNIPGSLSDVALMENVSKLVAQLLFALMEIVCLFVQRRGHAFRSEPEQ